MKVFVLNCGSSSIKYQLIEMPEQNVMAKGLVDKIGLEGSAVIHTGSDGKKIKFEKSIKNHTEGIKTVIEILTNDEIGILETAEVASLDADGTRTV